MQPENQNTKLSKSKFLKMRPKNVKLQNQRKLIQCLCEYCENVNLKITAFNNFAVRKNQQQLRINWQQNQFRQLNNRPPEKTVVLTMDFAENFSCFSQNEIQGAHWAKDSVTIHPVIARYQCKNQECNNSMVDDIIDIISNDLQHDVHAVQKFTEVIINFLREERGIDVEKMNDEEQDIENRNDEEQDIENRNDEEQDIENRNDEEQDIENRNDEEQDIENEQDKRDDDDDEIVTEDGPDLNMLNRNDEEQDIENEQDNRDDDDEIVTKDGPDDFLGSDLFTELPELK
ncbi:glutamic acid-rich protein-like, partial [Mytilus californianus]|uniref:glutamic acid-rich protein-like n=1 Tax=Mytilus californianus TaxID=6549 RepID=UPI002247FC7E